MIVESNNSPFYRVYTYRMTFQGCGSMPQQYSTDIYIQTDCFQLARQVFIFHLTGKRTDQKFSQSHKSLIYNLLQQFQKQGVVSFEGQHQYEYNQGLLYLQIIYMSNNYLFDEKRVRPFTRQEEQEQIKQKLQYLDFRGKQMQDKMSNLKLGNN